MAIPWTFDTGPDQGVFVFSADPAVVEANPPEAIEAYRESGDLAAIRVPEGATRFHLRPVDPGPLAALQVPALANVQGVEAMQRVSAGRRPVGDPARLDDAAWTELVALAAPVMQHLEDAKAEAVALGLERVDGWSVPPVEYGAVLRAMKRRSPRLARGLIAELYSRLLVVSELGPAGK